MLKRREGFTLIELLIVVVIIGILAAIAIPKFSATRERAFLSSMQSDLRNLATQQEIYYSNPSSGYSYSPSLTDLEFRESGNVTVTFVGTPNSEGWAAEATHSGLDNVQCAMYFGTVTTPPTTDAGVAPSGAGVVLCDDI